MKKTLITIAVAAMSLFTSAAFAASACETKAVDKNGKPLAGAAKTSFMKKCEAGAGGATASPACEKSAADKKLAGAAKTSHIKKCMADGGPKG